MNGLQSLRQAFTLLPPPYAPALLTARRGLASQPRNGDEINPDVPAHGNRVKNFADDDTTYGKEGVQGTLSRAVNAVTDTAHKVAESIKEVTGFKSTAPGEETSAERGARRTQESVHEGAARFKEGASQGVDMLKEGAAQARDNAEHGASQSSDRFREGASQAREGASQVGDKAREGANQVGEKAQQGWEKTKDVAQDLKEGAQSRAEQVGQGAKGAWEKAKEAIGNLEPERHQQRAEERRSARTADADSEGMANADRASPPYARPGVGPADQAGS